MHFCLLFSDLSLNRLEFLIPLSLESVVQETNTEIAGYDESGITGRLCTAYTIGESAVQKYHETSVKA
jgi:hypothetical protein